jgi:predicted nucleic acid-binding protein
LTGQVLVDTGPIVAILLESDEHHEPCVEQLHHIRGPLLTCWPVITEAAWLLRAYPEAIRKLLSSFHGRPFELAPLGETDLPGIAAILTRYEGLRIQLADASLCTWRTVRGLKSCSPWTGVTLACSVWPTEKSYG